MRGSLALSVALHGISFLVGAVSLGIGAFLYLQYRTPVLRRYLLFVATLFLFVLSFSLRLAAGLVVEPPAGETLGYLALFCEMVAATVQVLILPQLIYGLAGRATPPPAHLVAVLTAVAMGGAAIYFVIAPRSVVPQIVLSVLLFGTIVVYLALMASWLVSSRRGGKGPDASFPPRIREAAGAIRAFLIVSACFIPLFILDIVGSMAGYAGSLSILDNSSVPVFLLIICSGSIVVAYRYLSHPPLLEEQSVTDAAKAAYGLTDREVELIEYVLEGYTLPDAAGVLGIAAKTAENHLYNAYRKTGVTNRIQLFQLFTDNRRG